MRSFSSEIWPLAVIAASAAVVAVANLSLPATAETTVGDWMALLGGVAGGVMTLIAAKMAFGLTRKQVDMQAVEIAGLEAEREARAELLVALLTSAASTIQAKAQNNLARIPNEPDEPFIVDPLRLLQENIGFSEAWRLPEDIILNIVRLDIAVGAANDRLRHLQLFVMTKDDLTDLARRYEIIQNQAKLVVEALIFRASKRHSPALS